MEHRTLFKFQIYIATVTVLLIFCQHKSSKIVEKQDEINYILEGKAISFLGSNFLDIKEEFEKLRLENLYLFDKLMLELHPESRAPTEIFKKNENAILKTNGTIISTYIRLAEVPEDQSKKIKDQTKQILNNNILSFVQKLKKLNEIHNDTQNKNFVQDYIDSKYSNLSLVQNDFTINQLRIYFLLFTFLLISFEIARISLEIRSNEKILNSNILLLSEQLKEFKQQLDASEEQKNAGGGSNFLFPY